MAPGEEIVAWLHLRDVARFRRDAKKAVDSIDDIGDAADRTGGPVNQLGGALGAFSEVMPSLTNRTRIFGFAVGTVLTALLGVIPLAIGLGGALVALAGSFGAAAIGAGLLALSLGTVLAAGLGAVGLVLFDVMKNFQEVNTRFQTWRVAVKAFGRDSDQAATAFKRLQAVIGLSGGPEIFKAVQAWTELRNEFEDRMAPVIGILAQGMVLIFDSIRKLMPSIVAFTKIVAGSLLSVLGRMLKVLTGGEFKSGLSTIASLFARIAGPIGNGVINIFLGLLRLVVGTGPQLGGVADGFERITAQFAEWAKTANLSPFFAQFRSWMGLLRAVGGLLFTILSGGAAQGRSLVDSLTSVINKWNDFLKTSAGQKSLHDFFRDSIAMTKAFMTIVGGLIAFFFRAGRAAIPAYTKAFGAIKSATEDVSDALRPMQPFLKNILWPLLGGIAKGVIAGIVGSFKFLVFVLKIVSTVLGFVGEKFAFLKGPLNIVGQILGFVFGGVILRVLSMLGKLSILLGPIGFAFRLLSIPIRLAGATLGWLGSKVAGVIGFFINFAARVFPPFREALIRVVSFLIGTGSRFYNAGVRLWGFLKNGILSAVGSGLGFAADIGKAVFNFIARTFNSVFPNSIGPINLPNNPIPLLAAGGIVSGTGSWITGDVGPELNTLTSSGKVIVQPLAGVSVPSPSATLSAGGGKRTLVTKVYLRGKQIAEAVADEAEDAAARQ